MPKIVKSLQGKVSVSQIPVVGVPLPDYGMQVETDNLLSIESAFFLNGGSEFFRDGRVNPKGKPKSYHFWRIADILWNYHGSRVKIEPHPWAVRMIENLCKHDRLSIAGCASSGKSRTVAAWAIVNFIVHPSVTRVMLTSTTLKESRGRIWGDVEELWQALPTYPTGVPGQLVSSQGFIRYHSPATGVQNEKMGLFLVAGEKSKESESMGKLIGFKGERVILIADEMPELSDTLLLAAESNLSANPSFQMVGIGNPNSYYDPHGVFSEPINGWGSVSEADYEWQGKKSYVIRFNAEESPNFGPEGVKWPYLMTTERLYKFQRDLGEKSLRYYRMVKGFWFNESGEDTIYSPSLLQTGGAHDKAVYKGPVTMVAGFDPAHTHGGDDKVLTIGRVGEDVNGLRVIERVATYKLYDDTSNPLPQAHQIAEQVKAKCLEHGVAPEDLNVDSTGGGEPWCDVLQVVWSSGFQRVVFGGSPHDKDAYRDRMSELWFQGQALIRSGQIKGVDVPLAREMTARMYESVGKKIKVQPKSEMKRLIGHSPDNADSFFLMVDRAIRRGKVSAAEKPGNWKKGGNPVKKKFRQLASVWDG